MPKLEKLPSVIFSKSMRLWISLTDPVDDAPDEEPMDEKVLDERPPPPDPVELVSRVAAISACLAVSMAANFAANSALIAASFSFFCSSIEASSLTFTASVWRFRSAVICVLMAWASRKNPMAWLAAVCWSTIILPAASRLSVLICSARLINSPFLMIKLWYKDIKVFYSD